MEDKKVYKKEQERQAKSIIHREGVVDGYKKAYREMKQIKVQKGIDGLVEVLDKSKF